MAGPTLLETRLSLVLQGLIEAMVGVASGRVGLELATALIYLKESMARDEGRNGLRSDRMEAQWEHSGIRWAPGFSMAP